MRIAYNPKTSGPLPQAPGNNDITFDLAAKVIYARGTAFDGKAYKTFKKHDYDDDSGGWDGLVPAPSYSTANVRLLREDGQWVHIAGISSPDQELDEESINSVENKVITKKINELIALIGTKAVDVYKNIKVGNTTIIAKGVNDTLEFILGDGIMLVPNNKTISISINATGDLGIDVSYENGQLITKITKNYFDSWNETFDWYKSITDENTDEYIDKWQEIVDFLDELKKTDGNILDLFVTVHTDLVISGKKIFNNFLYLNDTKKYIRHTGGNSGYLEIFNETNVFSGLGLWDNGSVKVYTNSKWYDVIHSGNIGDLSVGTADKLKNKVKIWGQDFDGSGNVSGVLTLGTSYITGNSGADILNSQGKWCYLGGGTSEKGFPTYIDGHTIRIRYGTAHTEGVRISSSGNVGIGTTNPKTKLHIQGTTTIDGRLSMHPDSTGGILNGSLASSSLKSTDLAYEATTHFFSGGNVGIGTTNPKHKLDVNGAISTNNNIYASAIELSGTTPFIDFHFNESTADYTSRIIEESSGELTCKGRWKVGGTLTANSNLSVAGSTILKSMSATTGSFSGQITSTVADGTAPFSVTSTKVVAKLNADLLDGVHASELFTNLSNDTNLLSITIGGTNNKLTIDYAKAAGVLTSNAGTATNPIYFSGGKPVACTYSLNKTVPANAKFTDTTYSEATTSASGLMSVADKKKLDGITPSADAVSFSASLTSGTKVGTININGTDTVLYCHTNTWRGITDSYSGTDAAISLSQKGANNLYKALLNGYASSAGDSTKWGGYNIVVGSAGTDANTIYFVL